jgi:hypothetical protein
MGPQITSTIKRNKIEQAIRAGVTAREVSFMGLLYVNRVELSIRSEV